jgi:16S rRNA (adenine1518-N6/adenine1519-N6)-dimethyltransferase
MQTKRQIRQLLASAGIFPNKRLGQNFLVDLNLMRLLVDSANIGGDDVVLEVGCGTGSLTEATAEKAGKVIAVEFDRKLTEIAKRQLAGAENVEVINADVLESKNTISPLVTAAIEQARKKYSGRLILVANLPYNCACPVMMNLITGAVVADGMYVTVQKEMADRMIAAPRSGDYGILSIFLAATGEVKIIRVLKLTVFWPAPQVDSAMVSFLRNKEKVNRIRDMKLFGEVVNLFMGHRRKMIRACSKLTKGRLAGIKNWQEIFEKFDIDPTRRPEQIQPDSYIAIANLCYEYLVEKQGLAWADLL